MSSVLYGSKERAEKNKSGYKKSVEDVKEVMQRLCKTHLTAAFENPVNNELLDSQVKKFQNFLREEYE